MNLHLERLSLQCAGPQLDASTFHGNTREMARLATIRQNISMRLWPVNRGMTSLRFNELVDQMAWCQFDFELRIREDGES